jgi:hypothetical protein
VSGLDPCPVEVGGVPCGQPGALLIRYACLHEHVCDVPACAGHEELARNGRWVCTPCGTGTEAHLCFASHVVLEESR